MKRITRIISLAAAVIALALPAGCQKDSFKEQTDINLARCLQPTGLKASVSAVTGNVVTFSWNVTTDAQSYKLTILDKSQAELQTITLKPDQVPFSTTLTADETYYFQVQALNSKKGESKIAQYVDSDGKLKSFKTFAVKENLFPAVTDRQTTSVTFAWDKDKLIEDYKEVDCIEYGAPGSEDVQEYTLTPADIDGRTATVTGLTASTEYVFTLKFKSASRGQVDAWTLPDMTGLTEVSTAAALEQGIKDGANIKLTMAGSPYTIGLEAGIDAPKGVKIYGEGSADAMPVIIGTINVPDAADGNTPSYIFEGVEFNGNSGALGFAFQKANGGAKDGIKVGTISYKNCVITGYSKGIMYEWGKTLDIDEFIYESTTIYAVNADGSGGGDGFDLRQATKIGKLTFENCTIYNGFRSFIRIDANPVIGDFVFSNNTVSNLCFVDNTNNGGLFALQTVPSSFTMKNNLFLLMGEKSKLESENVKYKPFSDLGISASANYFYSVPETFFTTNAPMSSVAGKTLASDPCYNAKAGIFNIVSSSDIAGAGIGAAKWWTPYAKQPENLAQDPLQGACTWDLNDAKSFSGVAKEKMVRGGIMICASEAFPINLGDGKIEFTAGTPCTKKGVPTDNYLRFKVTEPGSVVVHAANSPSSQVIVATCAPVDGEANPTSVSVKGGAANIDGSSTPTKIAIKDIVEETMVLVYVSGPLAIDAIAWSKDVSDVNTALPAPKPKANPSSFTAGEATDVVITWDLVDNAESYSAVFNGKTYDAVLDESTGTWSYTVESKTTSMLDAGSYKVDIFANPAKGDIYNTMSEAGTAAFAVLPKGGGGETELIVKTVEELKAALSAGKTEITLATGTFDLTADIDYSGVLPVTATLSLKGQNDAIVKGALSVAGEVGDLTFNNINFQAGGQGCFITLLDSPAVKAGTVTVKNCVLDGYSKSAVYGNFASSDIRKVAFIGNTLKNFGTGQGVFDFRKGTYGTISIVDNTIAGGRDFIRTDAACAVGDVLIASNTFDGAALGASNGLLYVRAETASYKVVNNLFLNEVKTGANTILSKTSGVKIPNMKKNFYYNIDEAKFFSGLITETIALDGGAKFTECPVKDAANGDYTLTNAVAISCRAGASKWNPSIDKGETAEIEVKDLTELLAALDAGKKVISLKAGSYETGKITAVAGLRLLSSENAEIVGYVDIAGKDLGTMSFEGITFKFDEANACAINVSAEASASKLIVKNCTFDGFTKSVFYSNAVLTADAVTFLGCTVKNQGTGQGVFDVRKGSIGRFAIEQSTIIGGRDLVRADAGTVTSVFEFNNNTVDGANLGVNGNGIMYVRATPTVYNFKNNLFLNEVKDTKTVILSKTSGVTVPTKDGARNNFFYNYDEANFFSGLFTKEVAAAVCLSYNPCKDAANGDYTLTDALCLSSNVGALMWNPNRGRVTTEYTATSLEEFINGLNAGKSSIKIDADTLKFADAPSEETAFSGGILSLDKPFTIKGARAYGKNPVIVGGFKFNTGVTEFVAEGLVFDGNKKALGNLFEVAGALATSKIIARGCEIKEYSKSLFYGNAESTVGSASFSRLLVHDMGTGQGMFDCRKKVYGSIIIENSTIFNGGRDLIRCDATVGESICLRNNTLSYTGIDAGNGLLWVRSDVGDKYVVENNLFLNETGSTKLAKTGAQKAVFKKNFFFNLGTSFWSGTYTQEEGTANGGTVLTSDPCTDSANGNFKVTDATVKAAKAGDPRWL